MSETNLPLLAEVKQEIRRQRYHTVWSRIQIALAVILFPLAYFFHASFMKNHDDLFLSFAAFICIAMGVWAALMAVMHAMSAHFLRLELRDRRRGKGEKEKG